MDIATNKNLTDLTPSVFYTLASKCTKLERLELRGTARIKAPGPRRVLHEFFCRVIGVCDKAGTLRDLRLSQSASETDEADDLLQCLAGSGQRNLTSFVLVDMPSWFTDLGLA